MADSIDTAQEVEHALREAYIARHKQLRPVSRNSPSACYGCGDAIPQERQSAVPGTAFCADCATEHERQVRQSRR